MRIVVPDQQETQQTHGFSASWRAFLVVPAVPPALWADTVRCRANRLFRKKKVQEWRGFPALLQRTRERNAEKFVRLQAGEISINDDI